jgi:ubiquinone/menaquinone biosynthesis C-methylase UbiE
MSILVLHEDRTMNRRDFFNSRADTWDDSCRHDHDRINEILDLLPIRMGDAVMDVGAGTGVLIPFLLERIGAGGTITAIDMAEKMIRIAEEKFDCKNVRFVADDVFTADLPSSAFDVIICYSVFPHFDDKRDAVRLLARYLKADGVIAICHSQGRDQINSMHKIKSPAVAHDHLPTALEIEEHLEAAGFETDTIIDTGRLFVLVGRKRHYGEYVTEV